MSPVNEGNDDDDEIDFNELYLHYVKDVEEVRASESILTKQFQEVRNLKHFEYCHFKDTISINVISVFPTPLSEKKGLTIFHNFSAISDVLRI